MQPATNTADVKRETAPASTPMLFVNNIEVVHNHVILVLKKVSRAVPKGEIVALLGANGAFHGPTEPSWQQPHEFGDVADVTVTITPITSPFEGSATLTDAQAAELIAGRWYVNIHTDAYPAGEIRGQVVKGM